MADERKEKFQAMNATQPMDATWASRDDTGKIPGAESRGTQAERDAAKRLPDVPLNRRQARRAGRDSGRR